MSQQKKSNATSGDEQTGAVGWAVGTEHWEHWEDNPLGGLCSLSVSNMLRTFCEEGHGVSESTHLSPCVQNPH